MALERGSATGLADFVLCSIGKSAPACSSEMRSAFDTAETPPDPSVPNKSSLASFIVTSTSAIQVKHEKADAKAVSEEGYYALAY